MIAEKGLPRHSAGTCPALPAKPPPRKRRGVPGLNRRRYSRNRGCRGSCERPTTQEILNAYDRRNSELLNSVPRQARGARGQIQNLMQNAPSERLHLTVKSQILPNGPSAHLSPCPEPFRGKRLRGDLKSC